MGKNKTVISDQGVIEERDLFGKFVIVVSIVLSIALITLSVLTIVNP